MSAGRPAFYDNEQELSAKIEEYFEYIKGEFEDIKDPQTGKVTDRRVIRKPEPPTITGIALFLGFESRQSFYDYEEKGQFSYAIKRGRLRVENGYEINLTTAQSATGSIFALKNMGWKDKSEIDQRIEGELGIIWNETKTYTDPNA